jgi:hypothetical protein
MSRKHLPAAVLVSIGCSVALNEAPAARTARTMSCRSPDASGEAINTGDHQDVALPQKIKNGLELVAALGRGAAAFLGADHFAAGGLQRRLLDGEILIGGADPCVSDDRHVSPKRLVEV